LAVVFWTLLYWFVLWAAARLSSLPESRDIHPIELRWRWHTRTISKRRAWTIRLVLYPVTGLLPGFIVLYLAASPGGEPYEPQPTQMMTCAHCGAEQSVQNVYCVQCGEDIRSDPTKAA